MSVRSAALATAALAVALANGAASCDGDGDRPSAPTTHEISGNLTHSTATRASWADCDLIPPDPPAMGDQMRGAAKLTDFFNGTAKADGNLVPSGASQLAICSVGAQSNDVWLLNDEPLAEAVRFLNTAPESAEQTCTADYGVPWRIVFRYRDGSTYPLTVSHGGCGDAWNGEEDRTVLNPLLDRLLEVAADTPA